MVLGIVAADTQRHQVQWLGAEARRAFVFLAMVHVRTSTLAYEVSTTTQTTITGIMQRLVPGLAPGCRFVERIAFHGLRKSRPIECDSVMWAPCTKGDKGRVITTLLVTGAKMVPGVPTGQEG